MLKKSYQHYENADLNKEHCHFKIMFNYRAVVPS